MALPRQEKAYEKHAWMILFAGGIVGVVFALYFIFVGVPPDSQLLRSMTGQTWEELVAESPGLTTLLRADVNRVFGMTILGWQIFGMGIAAVSYRKGEKWAWYISWYHPAWHGAFAANNLILGGGTWPLYLVFVLVYLVGLLLPYRKFFPKKQVAPS